MKPLRFLRTKGALPGAITGTSIGAAIGAAIGCLIVSTALFLLCFKKSRSHAYPAVPPRPLLQESMQVKGIVRVGNALAR